MFILTPLIMYEQADSTVQIKNNTYRHQFSSVQSLQSLSGENPWLQHTRPPCPSPTPRDYSNSCPSSQWCHPAISYSVISFSSCPQSLKASGVFSNESTLHMRWPSTRVSASASVLPVNIQGWFPLGLVGLISLQSKGHSRVFPNTTVQKHQFFGTYLSLWSNSHIHTWWLLEKP